MEEAAAPAPRRAPLPPVLVLVRDLKYALINLFVAAARAAFFFLPDDADRGRALLGAHATVVVLVVAAFFAVEGARVRWALLAAALAALASQVLFHGCVVTRAEQALTRSDTTVTDGFLRLFGAPINRDTRMVATLTASAVAVAIMTWHAVLVAAASTRRR